MQALWPDSYFVIIVRHPLCVAYATLTWARLHGAELGPDAVVPFLEHWLKAHAILQVLHPPKHP